MNKLPIGFVPVLMLIVGLWVLRELDHWSWRVDAKWEAHNAAVNHALGHMREMHARFSDSLRTVEQHSRATADSLQRVADERSVRLAHVRDSLKGVERVEDSGPLETVISHLGMRQIDTDTYATDSTGVRRLNQFRQLALRYETEVPLLEEMVRQERARADAIWEALTASNERADSSEARVNTLEELLAEGQALRRCRIAGFLPCPSRTTSLVLGVLTGVGVAIALR